MAGYAEIAALIARRVRRRNDIVGATIVEAGALSNDTPTVTVRVGGASRRAIYLPPHAPVAGGPVFVCRAGSETAAPIIVIASNFQVTGNTDGNWGSGSRAWGTGSGLWGS